MVVVGGTSRHVELLVRKGERGARCRGRGSRPSGHLGTSGTWLQTAFTRCSLSSDSWGFPRYCCSSACRIRMEKGTMEPARKAELG